MPVIRRAVAAAAAVLVAALAVTVPSTAHAEDGDFGIALNLPDTIPGKADWDGPASPWTPVLVNNTDETVPVRFRADILKTDYPWIDLWEDDTPENPCSNANGCKFDLAPGTTEIPLLIRPDQGVPFDTPYEAVVSLTVGETVVTESGWFTLVPDGTDGRITFDLPETIPSSRDRESGGVPVPLTVTNNTDTTFNGGRIGISRIGVDEDDLVAVDYSPHPDDEACVGANGDKNCNEFGELAPGESYRLDMSVYVRDEGNGGEPIWEDFPEVMMLISVCPTGLDCTYDYNEWASLRTYTTVVADEDGDDAADPTLPKTGNGLTVPLLAGSAAVLIGGTLLLTTRRRRSARH